MVGSQLNRREAMASLLAVSAAGALAACSGGSGDSGTPAAFIDLTFAADGAFYSAAEMDLISALSDTIIPDTDTAGAVGAGVPVVIQGLASDWGGDDYRRYWRGGLRDLNSALKKSAGRDFTSLGQTLRNNALAKYDAQVFNGQIEDAFYRDLKRTVVQAYYMTEVGATEELAYEPVPGEWKGCVPLSDYPKNWAT